MVGSETGAIKLAAGADQNELADVGAVRPDGAAFGLRQGRYLPERDNEPSGNDEGSPHKNWSVRHRVELEKCHHLPDHEKRGDIEPDDAGEWQWREIEHGAVNEQQDGPDKQCENLCRSSSLKESDPNGCITIRFCDGGDNKAGEDDQILHSVCGRTAYADYEAVARLLLMPSMPKHRTHAEHASDAAPKQGN